MSQAEQKQNIVQEKYFYQENEQNSNILISSLKENNYISQFLSNEILNQSEAQVNRSPKIQTTTNISLACASQIMIKQDKKSLKSKFHNYQKHLIITLRKHIGLKYLNQKDINMVGLDLWKCFLLVKTYNKSLLRIIFGQLTEGINQQLFKKEGFQKFLYKYDPAQIHQAQKTLRLIVLDFFNTNLIQQILKERKFDLKTKKLFSRYVEEFILEMQSGNLMKRLPKLRKTGIQARYEYQSSIKA